MSTPMPAAENPFDSFPAQELVAELETQLGRMAVELTAAQLRIRRRDHALQERDDEIRYLRSLLPPDNPDTVRETPGGDHHPHPGAPQA